MPSPGGVSPRLCFYLDRAFRGEVAELTVAHAKGSDRSGTWCQRNMFLK